MSRSALVGSEGTCVVILEAKVRLLDNPPARSLLVLGYTDVYEAGDHVPEIMRARADRARKAWTTA